MTAPFLGQPLGMHAVTALAAVAVRQADRRSRMAWNWIMRRAGYDVVRNPAPEACRCRSARHPGRAGRRYRGRADRALCRHAARHRDANPSPVDAAHGPDTVPRTSDGIGPRPPVLFGAGRFDALERLEGDAGARDMILAGRHVVASPDELIDVDTKKNSPKLLAKFGGRADC